jgi:heavy metal sensor kinase
MVNTRSIHFRLVLWYSGLTIVVSVLFGLYVYYSVMLRTYDEVNELLRLRGINIATTILPAAKSMTQRDLKPTITQVFSPEASNRFIRILDAEGNALYTSGRPKDGHFDPARIPILKNPPRRRVEYNVGDYPMIMVTAPAVVGGKPYIVELGAQTDVLQALLDQLHEALMLGFPLLAFLLGAGGFALVSSALKPVDNICSKAERITFRNLSDRLPVERTGDQIEYLSITLNQMLGRLDAAYQHASRFSADAAHELRTPLTVIRGELEYILAQEKLPEKLQERIGSVLEETERLSDITRSLLAIARLDAGEARIASERFDLAAMAAGTAEQMSLLAEEKDLRLRIDAPESVFVDGDPARVKEVVVNLLDNAIKYTLAGGRVNLRVFPSSEHAVIEVADTGIGIPADALPHVFERFYRVDKARSRQLGGTGLGLSIAQSICQAHGGTISIQSELDRGTLCRVELPLSEAA